MPSKRSSQAWNPEFSVGFWINHTSRVMMRLHEARLRPLGLSMGQLPVLIALAERGALAQKELAGLARVEQPTMAELLARMERDGLVQREPNPEDKRGSLISLTSTARERLTQAKAALIQNEDKATTDLSPEEKTTLMGLLQRVLTNLEEDTGAVAMAAAARRRRAT